MTHWLPRRAEDETEADAVAAWLSAHPDFLKQRPDLYRHLAPPQRVHGETMADHMQARIEAERLAFARAEQELASAAAAGRAGASLILGVRRCVLALMRAPDAAETVVQEFPAFLGLACAGIVVETPTPESDLRSVPAGTVARLLGRGRDALVRAEIGDGDLLHGEAAPLVTRDALIRLERSDGVPAMLVLGARDPTTLPLHQSTDTLAFLGRAVAAGLAPRPGMPRPEAP